MPIKIFADGADLTEVLRLDADPRISGMTSNPSLCRKAGITNYLDFCQAFAHATSKSVSLEVIADEFDEMERQAKILSALGENVYVKIPITNTRGESCEKLIERLSAAGVKLNVTAVFTRKQIESATRVLRGAPAILSIFAGRIADAGVNPAPLCRAASTLATMNIEILWASTRELFNIKQAEDCGCDIITVPNELLKKFDLIGKDLTEYSLETVRMFRDDALASGYSL